MIRTVLSSCRMRSLLFLILMSAAAGLLPAQAPSVPELAFNTSAAASFPGEANGNAPAGTVSKIGVQALLYSGASTRVLARFMPWFDGQKHKDSGYRSDDAGQIRRQVSDMLSRGISGAAVAWYGRDDKFKDRVTAELMKQAEATDGQFVVALSYSGSLEECRERGCDTTKQLISDLNYAAEEYFSSPAYLRVNGRPVLFFFDLDKFGINWKEVRKQVQGRPLFLFRNRGGFDHAESDGAYSWIEPGQASGDDPAGLKYLRWFYQGARQRPDRIVVGSVYKGFDDSAASWGKGRRVDQRCGDTWLDTWELIGNYFDAKHQLPFVLVVTWNDYEEGTEVESGIDDCVSLSATLQGRKLAWQTMGNERAVDHYAVYASSGGVARHLTDVAASFHQLDMGAAPADEVTVQAVGKPCIRNHAAVAK